ncbi:MAG: helix-turn-helix transcriptional regulator [Solibacillus sp.]|uniref:helix-turn-helix domain-containing protein n=1 Tax=Solibacillus sp. TaxID=1909654 RepID=UPI003315A652
MDTLGERIKKLRKEKKYTQTELAGDRLTKGMLSLIENNKAQPSMESLRFLAKQLGVEVSELLDDGTLAQLRNLYTEIEEDIERRELLIDPEQVQSLSVNMIEKIEPYLAQIQGTNYEQIRLREVYYLMNRTINKAKSLEEYWKFIDQYEAIHAYSRMLRCYFYLAFAAMEQRNYQDTLAILKQGEQSIAPYELLIDPIVRLDLYYNLTVAYSAIDDIEMSERYLQKALGIAKRKHIFYRMANFYELIFIHAVANKEYDKSTQYFQKLKLLADFSEDASIARATAHCHLHYVNNVERNYSQIDQIMAEYKAVLANDHYLYDHPKFICEQMYAQFHMKNYEQALVYGKSLKIPGFIHHPIDLAMYYRFYAIRALAYYYLEDFETAKKEIIYAKNGVEDFPDTIYKQFVLNAYSEIFFD